MTNNVDNSAAATGKWLVVISWNLEEPANYDDPEYTVKRQRQIRNVMETIAKITGFRDRSVLRILRKAQDFGHAILRRSNVEVCERTQQALKAHNISCIMFPE